MRKLVDTLNIAVSVIACLYVICLGFRVGLPHNMTVVLALLIVFGTLVLVLNLLLAVREIRAGLFRRNLALTTEEGTNTIGILGLEAELLEVLREAGDLSRPTIHLDVRGEGAPIECTIRLALKPQSDVMGRVDQLKKAVRETFLRILPHGPGIEITAHLDLAKEPAAGSGKADEFQGPVYPDNGEADAM